MGLQISSTILKPLLLLLLTLCTFKCSRGCVERERLALLDFKTSFTPPSQNSHKLLSWNSSKECCSWEGITCDDSMRHVISLDLSCNGYHLQICYESNNLRPSLLELQYLRRLELRGNNLIIPEFIGSLSKLTYLDLSECGLFGMIPPQIGNLSNLQVLDLSLNMLSVNNFQWLSHLSKLKSLDLSNVNCSEARDWLSVIINLPSLSDFGGLSCNFPIDLDWSSTSTHHVNSSSSLQSLDLSENKLSSTLLSLIINSTRNISDLTFDTMEMEGPFPDFFNDMTSLEFLDVSGNHLEIGTIKSIGNLCNLMYLKASGSIIKESLTNILQALSPCASRSLEDIRFRSMNLTGAIPSFLKFQSLIYLDLRDNCLDNLQQMDTSNISSTPPIFPANLSHIFLGNNNLNGVISDLHFTNVSQLEDLDFGNNPNLTVSFNKAPAGAGNIFLSYCNLGPNFPSWLIGINRIFGLDISNCMITGTIPVMFWMTMPTSLNYLNLSSNSFYGIVPNIPFHFPYYESYIDLSSNAFCGPIPFFVFTANGINLSNNNFSGFAPIPHPYNFSSSLSRIDDIGAPPGVVDLSHNHLSGKIPHWIEFRISLGALILANNNLSGTIPSSIGEAVNLYVLNLRNNKFSGPLPSLLKNCSQLRILDLGGNHFYGFIPSWIGENLKSLSLLSLGSNSLMGILPNSLCHLSSLQIIDISNNLVTGNIPSCIHDLTAMTHEVQDSSLSVLNFEGNYIVIGLPIEDAPYYNAYIKWKSKVWKFQSNLPLVKLVDLSRNNFTGEIPKGVASLVELDSIDLSCNSLQGSIPEQIGQLMSLQYLNLSSNRLCGQIPQSLSEISALEMLDLSHNNLSGRIPKGTQLQTFDPSAFAENPDLCGLPLSMCPRDRDDSNADAHPTDESGLEEKWGNKQCFYAGLGAGFACSFFGILGTLTWIQKWRYAFFQFASEFGEWILLVLALSKSKISRKCGFK